ncbi:MAG: response regulator [Hungatella hathewayi]|nr:response regulator [Hungatella hathewayi]
MYRILVVDDEQMIADGLKFLIEKGTQDCEVVGVAYDGTEGIAGARKLEPDIILTDIRMYEMDGLEMIRRIKEEGVPARFIILSGYADFSYAKQAIALGVEEYITKPIEEEELYGTLRRVCLSIQQQKMRDGRLSSLEEAVSEYDQGMKQYRLRELLQGRTEVRESDGRFDFLNHVFYCSAVYESPGGDGLEKAFEEICKKNLEKEEDYMITSGPEPGRMVVCIGASQMPGMQRIINSLGKLRMDFENRTGERVSLGIGTPHRSVSGIKKSYEEALCALNYKVIRGPGSLVYYGEIRDILKTPSNIAREDVLELERCMNEMDSEGLSRIVESIFRKMSRQESLSPEVLQATAINLVLSGISKMPFMQLQLNEYLGKNILSLDNIAKFQTMEQLKHWIINVLQGMNELMLKQSMPEKRDVIEESKEYIARHFEQDITLNDISERFFINPYYFSQLFKKRTGVTYQKYLTGIRIARAKKLLEETDLKLFEISEMVGYSDVNYFRRVFEKYEGVKPNEYRKQL